MDIRERSAEAGAPRPALGAGAWSALALLIFSAALASHCAPLRGHDPTVFVVAARTAGELDPQARYEFASSDRRFAVALVAQNARAFLTRPGRLFQAEPCHPAQASLALGHPGLALGLLGVPAWIATGDPVATFNFAVTALRLLAALAMFLLVADWTRVAAAGVVAGLLYAFHVPSAEALVYPFIFDTVWIVLGLFFARRFCVDGHWRDALGASACCVLQVAESFYALLAAVLIALPMGCWMLLHYRRRVRPLPGLVALVLAGAALAYLLGPFLERPASAPLAERGFQAFATADQLRPGAVVSWLAGGLAALGLALRVRGRDDGDARWALALAALLVAAVAIGGNETARIAALRRGEEPPLALPNLYALLTLALPWLGSVRAPGYAASGVAVCVGILSGLGAAALLERLPRRLAPLAASLLILAAYADALRPLGLPRSIPIEAARMRPPEADIAFFRALAEQGNSGPVFEMPVGTRVGAGGRGSAILQVLLSTYHQRRTSGCYNSFLPSETRELAKLAETLPDPGALAAIRARGFTTLVVHHAAAPAFVWRLDAARRQGALRRIRSADATTAYVFSD